MLVRAPMVTLLTLVALFYHRPIPVRPRWDWQRLLVLCKVGVPIYLLGQAWTFFISMDRLTLVEHTQALGYYTIALQASTAAQIIPTAFTIVIFPRLAQLYGETDRAMPLWILAKKAAIGATLFGGGIGVLGWIATPLVINRFLPNYKPGIAAAQWASFMGLAMGTYVFGNIFNVIRRQDLFAICCIIGLGGFWGSWWILGRLGGDKTVIAAQALLIGVFILSVTGVFTSLWACHRHDMNKIGSIQTLC
jgi:O-antigen/teichoic acid export membrane protein